MIAFIMQAWVSVQRINKFLNSEEVDPDNVTKNPSENALSIVDGTFTWGGETTTLKNINLKVKKGNLTAIVGSVGCGKTSLISSLLGEMEKIKGKTNVDGNIAYVPQQGSTDFSFYFLGNILFFIKNFTQLGSKMRRFKTTSCLAKSSTRHFTTKLFLLVP